MKNLLYTFFGGLLALKHDTSIMRVAPWGIGEVWKTRLKQKAR